METLISTENLTKSYGDFTLGPIDLTLEVGQVTGLVGVNGAGKTTLIKCLLGIVIPDGGAIHVLGKAATPSHPLSAATKEHIGVVFDTCPFADDTQLADIARLGRATYRRWNGELFDQLLTDFGLNARKKVSELSRGMGMKLSLAFALAHDPDLLLLDEATAGLDPLAREELLDILRQFMLDERHGILISSHITTDLEKIADQVVCIDHGRVIFDLPKDDIRDEYGVAYLTHRQLEELEAAGDKSVLHVLEHGAAVDALIYPRASWAATHPTLPVDRATIEEFMAFSLSDRPITRPVQNEADDSGGPDRQASSPLSKEAHR